MAYGADYGVSCEYGGMINGRLGIDVRNRDSFRTSRSGSESSGLQAYSRRMNRIRVNSRYANSAEEGRLINTQEERRMWKYGHEIRQANNKGYFCRRKVRLHNPTRSYGWNVNMDAKETIHKCSNIKRRDTKSHLFLFSLNTGMLLELNDTAKFIWDICDGRTMEDIWTLYAQEFEIEIDDARNDVEEIIQILRTKGYVS